MGYNSSFIKDRPGCVKIKNWKEVSHQIHIDYMWVILDFEI